MYTPKLPLWCSPRGTGVSFLAAKSLTVFGSVEGGLTVTNEEGDTPGANMLTYVRAVRKGGTVQYVQHDRCQVCDHGLGSVLGMKVMFESRQQQQGSVRVTNPNNIIDDDDDDDNSKVM